MVARIIDYSLTRSTLCCDPCVTLSCTSSSFFSQHYSILLVIKLTWIHILLRYVLSSGFVFKFFNSIWNRGCSYSIFSILFSILLHWSFDSINPHKNEPLLGLATPISSQINNALLQTECVSYLTSNCGLSTTYRGYSTCPKMNW